MKKIMLFMLGSAILATAAITQAAPTKPAQANALFSATLWGTNTITSDAYVQAYNTSTGQTYYMTIYANNSTSISLPPGTYNISISTGSNFCNMYVSNLSSYAAYNKTWWSFNSVNVTSSPSTVVSVTYN